MRTRYSVSGDSGLKSVRNPETASTGSNLRFFIPGEGEQCF
ncbi:MAG: hypothetical protein R3C26_02425 [Calditrichia bacterium]